MDRIIEIDLQRCCRAVFSKGLALLMALVFGLMAGYGVSLAFCEAENEYIVYSEVSCVTATDFSVIPFYAEVVKTANVAKRAVALLNNNYSVNQIMNLIQTNYKENVGSGIPIIEIGAVTRNPEEMVVIVDAVSEAFVAEMQNLTHAEAVRRLGDSSSVELQYNAKKTRLLITLGVGVGFALLLTFFIVLKEILALQLTTIKDGSLDGQLKLIGVIPRYKK